MSEQRGAGERVKFIDNEQVTYGRYVQRPVDGEERGGRRERGRKGRREGRGEGKQGKEKELKERARVVWGGEIAFSVETFHTPDLS